jgi:hypothetical protein
MINVSETAAAKISELLTEETKPEAVCGCSWGGDAPIQYGLMIKGNGRGSVTGVRAHGVSCSSIHQHRI